MPYIDIQHQDYENTLYLYTIALQNGRYDKIDNEGLTLGYSNNADATHSFDLYIENYNKDKDTNDKITKYYYNTYNTYRKFISYDSTLLKLNETDITNKELNKNAYNVNRDSSMNVYNLFDYKGIVLNYFYPINGRMATLEDIFAEYYYDYLVALDQQNEAENRDYYYFDKNLPYQLQFSYTILPIGDTFVNEDGENEYILYDGSTVPTTEDILLGKLYIVIKSGNQEARRIYFNNEYGPSLFLNDDKYNLKYLGLTTDNYYQYILNDNQPFKLCDITRFRSWGWHLTFGIKEEVDSSNHFIQLQFPDDDSTLSISIDYDGTNNDLEISFRLYTYAMLLTRSDNNIKIHQFVIGNDPGEITKKNIETADNIKFCVTDFSIVPSFNNEIWNAVPDFIFDNKNTMGNVFLPKTEDEQTDFVFCMYPCLLIKSKSGGYNYISTSNDNIITIIPTQSTNAAVIPIKNFSCVLNSEAPTIYPPNTIKENDISQYGKPMAKYKDGTIIQNSQVKIEDTNTTSIKNILQAQVVSQNAFKLDIPDITLDNVYGFALTHIPFNDLTDYRMQNIIKLSLPTTITIKVANVEPGFFIKDDEYIPAFMEYVDEDEEPIFIYLS